MMISVVVDDGSKQPPPQQPQAPPPGIDDDAHQSPTAAEGREGEATLYTEADKAERLELCACSKVHTVAFHLAWSSFFVVSSCVSVIDR
jgi:hypothetical protein